ncbi:hypothetical protein [Bradyrhizobium sp. BRP56]|uniref:hypothetical protein n=1 Tax=Bradyrhizobium sp. BRP56 TaxID=2793819 RepID=UPI001CD3C00B|nr:hypothetical protein [Bradyrhizobium sp. BRP56]MCA1398994.1 hypothetical protein [Bradyrhizobium sp. BRP56]
MNAENDFAARLIDAGRLATIARTCGLRADVSHYVNKALKELWQTQSPEEARKIAERWVFWDAEGKPWPCMPPLDNVVQFHRASPTQISMASQPATPLQAIWDWFERQDEEARTEIPAWRRFWCSKVMIFSTLAAERGGNIFGSG